MTTEESPKILSIQSHVVHGYVGNRSAVFPLQLLGFEVDFINSVQLCTHTQYQKVTGQILKEKDLADLFLGLKENGIDNYDYLLTGYVGSPSFLQEIINVYKDLKSVNKNIVFVCDPVMGDNGQLYVPEELVPLYKNVVPYADILTPNHFELELLTDMNINTVNDAWEAIDSLHEKGCDTVVVSSSELGESGFLVALASSTKSDVACRRATISVEKKPGVFVGTGDIFAALMLAWMHKSKNDVKLSLERTIASLQAVLERTLLSVGGKPHTPANLELKLIQSKRDIENPNVIISAKCLNKLVNTNV